MLIQIITFNPGSLHLHFIDGETENQLFTSCSPKQFSTLLCPALCPRKLTSMDPGPCTSLGVPPMKESAEERNIGIMIPAPCQAIVLKWLGSSTYGTTLIGGPSPQTQLSLVPTTISPSSASGLRVAMFPLLLVLK